ncbi:MAG: hydroxylase [Pseudomonadota bacterium]
MDIEYLEIVTRDVEGTCATLSAVHSVSFGAPEPGFGNARMALLGTGGRLGVRAPLSESEGAPLVRPYLRVADIEAAIASAEASGADVAMRATEIAGHGKFAIYFQGGIQHGVWEVPAGSGTE